MRILSLIKDETVAEYADLQEKLELVMLPPYSPDLNPIEQVWRVTRREMTHNRYCPSRAALEERLDGYFSPLRIVTCLIPLER